MSLCWSLSSGFFIFTCWAAWHSPSCTIYLAARFYACQSFERSSPGRSQKSGLWDGIKCWSTLEITESQHAVQRHGYFRAKKMTQLCLGYKACAGTPLYVVCFCYRPWTPASMIFQVCSVNSDNLRRDQSAQFIWQLSWVVRLVTYEKI